jgi:tetratricopeptide (TPR) repeat protein
MSCAIVIAMLAGTIVSTYFAIDARQKAAVARAKEQDALDSKRDAQEVTKFLVDAFASPDPDRDGRTITVAEVLDRAEKRLEKELLDQPVTRAAMLDAIGKSRVGLGFRREGVNLLREAQRIRERELGPAHDDTLDSLSTLANVCRGVDGMRYIATAMQQQLVRIKVEKLGADATDTLDSLHFLGHLQQEDGYYSGAIDSFEKSLAMRRQQLGNTHPVIVEWSACLITAYDAAGRADDALRLMTSLLDSMGQGPEPNGIDGSPGVDTASHRSLNGHVASNDSLETMYQRVITVFEQNLTARKREFGANSIEITNAIGRLKQIYRLAGDLDKALQLQEEEVAIRRAKEPHSQETLTAMNQLANDYDDSNRTEEAIVLYKETLALRQEKLGLDHPDTLSSLNNLAAAYANSGRLEEAVEPFRQLFEERKKRLGLDHPDTLRSMWSLANCYLQTGHREKGLSILDQTLTVLQQNPSIEDSKTLTLMSD